ncbi:MAG: 30S ribosome-binding factor RbfA [Thermodesulfobacteriota bacterium]
MGQGYKRSARLSDLIVKEISDMISKGEIRDPRVSLISITGIRVSNDLGFAKIFFTPLIEDSDKDEALKGLMSATGYIKTQLSKRLRVKKIPKIEFEYDYFFDKSQRLDEIIRSSSDE